MHGLDSMELSEEDYVRRRMAQIQQQVQVSDLLVHDLSIWRYFSSAKQLLAQARVYRSEKAFEKAFIMFQRYATLILEVLPKHKEYASVGTKNAEIRKECLKALDDGEQLKALLKQRWCEEYRALYEKQQAEALKAEQAQIERDAAEAKAAAEAAEAAEAAAAHALANPRVQITPVSELLARKQSASSTLSRGLYNLDPQKQAPSVAPSVAPLVRPKSTTSNLLDAPPSALVSFQPALAPVADVSDLLADLPIAASAPVSTTVADAPSAPRPLIDGFPEPSSFTTVEQSPAPNAQPTHFDSSTPSAPPAELTSTAAAVSPARVYKQPVAAKPPFADTASSVALPTPPHSLQTPPVQPQAQHPTHHHQQAQYSPYVPPAAQMSQFQLPPPLTQQYPPRLIAAATAQHPPHPQAPVPQHAHAHAHAHGLKHYDAPQQRSVPVISRPGVTEWALKASQLQMRTVVVYREMLAEFLKVARMNTARGIEFCGILAGTLSQNCLFITHLIIPKQEGTDSTCTMLNEEDLFVCMDKLSLITVGWIHTHPTQDCFMSSIDLHTHCGYQSMLPEALAIVMAPSRHAHGIFSLHVPDGLSLIQKCQKSGFHTHSSEGPIYVAAAHVQVQSSTNFRVVDLRGQ
eukprot:TRINITY_DN7230_c0_g1_i1.p1 TRINITY_DN7230_c0_g1~~TRINITY_DN7230_c0_g1_i1.p1  ORF type:complete len:632 (+),score=126.25 TRINITY_DN7230_c0_g1_i1:64-1959(+)